MAAARAPLRRTAAKVGRESCERRMNENDVMSVFVFANVLSLYLFVYVVVVAKTTL